MASWLFSLSMKLAFDVLAFSFPRSLSPLSPSFYLDAFFTLKMSANPMGLWQRAERTSAKYPAVLIETISLCPNQIPHVRYVLAQEFMGYGLSLNNVLFLQGRRILIPNRKFQFPGLKYWISKRPNSIGECLVLIALSFRL